MNLFDWSNYLPIVQHYFLESHQCILPQTGVLVFRQFQDNILARKFFKNPLINKITISQTDKICKILPSRSRKLISSWHFRTASCLLTFWQVQSRLPRVFWRFLSRTFRCGLVPIQVIHSQFLSNIFQMKKGLWCFFPEFQPSSWYLPWVHRPLGFIWVVSQ